MVKWESLKIGGGKICHPNYANSDGPITNKNILIWNSPLKVQKDTIRLITKSLIIYLREQKYSAVQQKHGHVRTQTVAQRHKPWRKKNVVTKPCPKKKKPITAGKVYPTRMSVTVVYVFILKSTRLIYFTSIEIFCQKWGI